jgi:CrcB protein
VKLLLVLIGGGLGAGCRYAVGLAAARLYGDNFPWGTLAVNLVGCFLIGLTFALGATTGLSPSLRLFLMTGFLGALTTFSTFALETVSFARDGLTVTAIANVLAHNVGGLIAALLGMWAGRIV